MDEIRHVFTLLLQVCKIERDLLNLNVTLVNALIKGTLFPYIR